MKQSELFGDILDTPLKRFEDIHNYLYANDGLSEQQTLEEIIKILFIKYFDEQNTESLFCIKAGETSGSESFLNRIKSLFDKTKNKYKTYFDEKDILKLSNTSLFFVVSKVQKINFLESTKDSAGIAFQKFLGRQAKVGRGQFFTPDPVIDFCVEIIQPQPDEKIIDPACGTGGFLFSALNYIKRKHANQHIGHYVSNNIFGIEINKKISQIAKIKFLIATASEPNIICTNSLKPLSNMDFLGNGKNDIHNFFDIVLTNPPFGSQGKVQQKDILANYHLGHKWEEYQNHYYQSSHLLKGQVPDVLFVEQCLNLLKPGGRLGIVLPNGHFENTSAGYLRQYIKEKANILGVVLLPQETFIPYGTGVKASLLFLQKKDNKEGKNYKIFFSKIDNLGYAGNKNGTPIYKKDKMGVFITKNGSKVINEDFTEAVNDYKNFLNSFFIKTDKSFSIDADQLNNRFDYNYYLPKNSHLLNILKKQKAVELGSVASIVKTKSPQLKQNGIVEYVELSDINTKTFEIIKSTPLLTADIPSRASYELKTGDIITAVAGNSIGTAKHATALVTQKDNNAICTNGFRVLRHFNRVSPYYLLYYFQSDLFLKQIFMYRTGAAIPAISDKDFSSILVYLPPSEQMNKIISTVEKIFELRNKANNLLSTIEDEIDIG